MLVGYLRDRSTSYQTGFFTLIGVALIGAVAVASLPQKRTPVFSASSSASLASSAVETDFLTAEDARDAEEDAEMREREKALSNLPGSSR
jgi:hypothetical protein